MNLEPEKFFIGVIDLFSIFVPGGLLVLLGKDWIATVSHRQPLELRGNESWMMFLFLAYLLGHIVYLVGAAFDEVYDHLRSCNYLGQVERLARGEKLSPAWLRGIADWMFSPQADKALIQAVRIKTRALTRLSATHSINTFQWCKARLSKEHREGLAAVQRFEADSKFFRSFVVVLLALGGMYAARRDGPATLVCAVLLLPTFWRYADQRFKSTQQAYWFVITLESLKDESVPVTSVRPEPGEPTHAGGIVFRSLNVSKQSMQFLLVQESKNRKQWVLPKGHIELGENPREAAVREVEEETAQWARVVGWEQDAHFGDEENPSVVRLFRMELVQGSEKKLPPGERESKWLEETDDKGLNDLYPETRALLQTVRSLTPQSTRDPAGQ